MHHHSVKMQKLKSSNDTTTGTCGVGGMQQPQAVDRSFTRLRLPLSPRHVGGVYRRLGALHADWSAPVDA